MRTLVLASLLASSEVQMLSQRNTFLDGHESHGGQGVYQEANDRVYLLDMVEQGNEEAPYIAGDVTIDPQIAARLDTVFRDIPGAPSAIVAAKIAEIARWDALLAETLLRGMEMHLWRIVWPELVDTHDSNTPLSLGSNKLVQLAVRRLQNISISRPWWNKMSPENRAALIFHEAIYALIRPKQIEVPYPNWSFYHLQDHEKVREIVGYLFSYALSDRQVKGLKVLLADSWTGSGSNLLPLGGLGRVKSFGERSGVIRWAFACKTGSKDCSWASYNGESPKMQAEFSNYGAEQGARVICKNWIAAASESVPDLTLVGFSPIASLQFESIEDQKGKRHDYLNFSGIFNYFANPGPLVLASKNLAGLTKANCETEVGAVLSSWL